MPDAKELWTLTAAASHAGVLRTTMTAAVDRGEIRSYMLGDGVTRVVRIADVLHWKGQPRKRGPKPKKK